MHARRGAGDHFRLARRQGIEGMVYIQILMTF